jgi:hypothetical protein
MRLMRILFLLATLGMLIVPVEARSASGKSSKPEEFAIFDGRVYNGKYYPRVDIIEWDYPPHKSHMEFHIYWKGKPVDLSFELETKTGRPVMLVRYHLKERNEILCRRVLAPGHFFEEFYVYRDHSDPDFDNIIVSAEKFTNKPKFELIKTPSYMACEEPKDEDRFPAADEQVEEKHQAPPSANNVAPVGEEAKQTKQPSNKGALKKSGAAVPFSDW